MRVYRLKPSGRTVMTTTWLGGLVHCDGDGFWNTLRKFIPLCIWHVKMTRQHKRGLL